MTHTVSIVLNIDAARAAEFEAAFREHELPVWQDLHSRGVLLGASLSPLEISTIEQDGCRQYLVIARFGSFEGHHEHDEHPGFKRWNALADQYQPAEPYVFGGNAVVEVP